MIILDTNVISEFMRVQPSTKVIQWLNNQISSDVWLTAITVAELLYGVGRMPDGVRKLGLTQQLEGLLSADFDRRIAAFDAQSAPHYADIVVTRERIGRPISSADAQIASICRSHNASLATRNIDDFDRTGITVLNPWD